MSIVYKGDSCDSGAGIFLYHTEQLLAEWLLSF